MDSEYWIRESIKDRIVEDDYELGDQLGRYLLIWILFTRVLHINKYFVWSGISSVVHACKHRLVNKNWAVKTIEKDKPRSKYDELRDTAVLFSVNHPNLVCYWSCINFLSNGLLFNFLSIWSTLYYSSYTVHYDN